MSIDTIYSTVSPSSDATERLAEHIGQQLHGGEVIELISDVGGGKTTFVRGLARGLGSKDTVASPSFTINKVYKAGAKTLYHFDFYKMADPGMLTHELQETLEDARGIVVIEWANVVEQVLPKERLTIKFSSSKENERKLDFNFPKQLAYLVEGL